MADANAVKNKATSISTNQIIVGGGYPEVSVSIVHFMDDEVQIEQGRGYDSIDLGDGSNDIISMSEDQARKLAKLILETIGE